MPGPRRSRDGAPGPSARSPGRRPGRRADRVGRPTPLPSGSRPQARAVGFALQTCQPRPMFHRSRDGSRGPARVPDEPPRPHPDTHPSLPYTEQMFYHRRGPRHAAPRSAMSVVMPVPSVPRLLGSHALRQVARHPGPGSRERGRLDRGLCPGDHPGGSDPGDDGDRDRCSSGGGHVNLGRRDVVRGPLAPAVGPGRSAGTSHRWWSYGDSNPGPPACHAGALPTGL